MSRKIIILDDDLVSAKLVGSRLEANGYQTIHECDGREVLRKIQTDPPDLIITDVLMPDMDGYTFYKELKANTKTARIPVMVVTGRAKMEDTFQVAGVDCFLTKPINIEALISEVDRLIPGVPGQPLASPTPPVASDKPVAQPPLPPPEPRSKAEPVAAPVASKTAKKIFVGCHDDEALDNICHQLTGAGHVSFSSRDPQEAISQYEVKGIGYFLFQLHQDKIAELEKTVEQLGQIFKKIAREGQQKGKATDNSFVPPPIILFDIEAETSALDSLGEKIAARETVLMRLQEKADVKYMGSFMPFSFLQKIKKFLA